jgi:hypothetical protein
MISWWRHYQPLLFVPDQPVDEAVVGKIQFKAHGAGEALIPVCSDHMFRVSYGDRQVAENTGFFEATGQQDSS